MHGNGNPGNAGKGVVCYVLKRRTQVEYVSEKGVSGQLWIPLLNLHAEVGNPFAQNMIAKLELFVLKPEINIQERYSNFWIRAGAQDLRNRKRRPSI
jgi:hypothetical protein